MLIFEGFDQFALISGAEGYIEIRREGENRVTGLLYFCICCSRMIPMST